MESTKQVKFIIVVGLQIFVLFAIIIYKTAILASGTDIVLKLQPVDPKDFLRGDYVSLRYDINNIDLNKISVEGEKSFKTGENIYVSLKKEQDYFSAEKANHQKPMSNYFIKGMVSRGGDGAISVQYGIESYFMPEGNARDLEQLTFGRQNNTLLVGVKVDRSGNALINKIIIAGKEIDASNFREVASSVEYYRNQSLGNVEVASRDAKRQADIRQFVTAMELCYDSTDCGEGTKKYLTSATMPTSIDIDNSPILFQKIPSDSSRNTPYNWISNLGKDYGYCVYAVSESFPATYYIGSSKGYKTETIEPKTLEDCGVKKSIALVGGYIFIDSNKNEVFDKGDGLFQDINVSLSKAEILKTGGGFTKGTLNQVKPDAKGYYQFEIFDAGNYKISPILISRSIGAGTSGSSKDKGYFEIKGGEKINNYNFFIFFY
ncbi:MAG: GDYXXLXY domain-containing protein [Candidatus Brennerbacteria bacterium]|nr:GDYXXLXY domain-containing protein [Candidatus Brennerbacteria bacterium]